MQDIVRPGLAPDLTYRDHALFNPVSEPLKPLKQHVIKFQHCVASTSVFISLVVPKP